MKMVRLGLWGLVFVAAVVLAGRFYLANNENQLELAASAPGGPFVLTAHTGETVSNTDFLGRYMLVYFGYSFCPDVCPLDLQKMTVALRALEEEGYDTTPIQPLFISIDPERDTVAELAGFLPDFHPRLLGLTGSLNDIKAVAKNYKVYFAKREQPGTTDYLMDHQALIFVMDPEGNFVRLFSSRDKPDDIAKSLATVLTKTN